MIYFFQTSDTNNTLATEVQEKLSSEDIHKLIWLFGKAKQIEALEVSGSFIGPHAYMTTPWSTNAVEMTQNMGIKGITRIECFEAATAETVMDPMLFQQYEGLNQDIFSLNRTVEQVKSITDIASYNDTQNLGLNTDEIDYLNNLSKKIARPLTDTEIFGFSQINSEHCRHKIFNGQFIIDGTSKTDSLFGLIKKTTANNDRHVVSAYKDNVAFLKGPDIQQFAPERSDEPSSYYKKNVQSIISLKAETHNFPTTVEPFSGAATGSGGEIRDRLAGGQGSNPLAGTAVYMTAYPRFKDDTRAWVDNSPERPWLYQSPFDILMKASNGASDFGNKFGQPLITGSLLTFEHQQEGHKLGFDKVIMLAGGVGEGRADYAQKKQAKKGDKIVILGGDNYRIGMGGAAVSSFDTGTATNAAELNAVQRSNPEMQKRVANVIRFMMESDQNDIISIHDHGAGGHLNCLAELLESVGGVVYLDRLPVGDPTLSAKEILSNESQERMGLIVAQEALPKLATIAQRERAPMCEVGEVTEDGNFSVIASKEAQDPINLNIQDLFGNTPKMVIQDQSKATKFDAITYDQKALTDYLTKVLKLESVACKDWLTNKVDRCVTGRIAKQQCTGPLQLPLNNCGVVALDYEGQHGIATSTGSSPLTGLISPEAGARNSVAEALTNLIWAPLTEDISSVSLSANWMWPAQNPGENDRLYQTVEALSSFCIALGIPVPTGKDSLSMTQKYKDYQVQSPGTVIVSAIANCTGLNQIVEPTLQKDGGAIYYLDLSGCSKALGGSALAQVLNQIGDEAPSVKDATYFKNGFNAVQTLIKSNQIVAGHDISSGGLITTLLEMCFADLSLGATLDLTELGITDLVKGLFSENIGVVFQVKKDSDPTAIFKQFSVEPIQIGQASSQPILEIKNGQDLLTFDVNKYRSDWYHTSYLFDREQSGLTKATERKETKYQTPLVYQFPSQYHTVLPTLSSGKKPVAGVLREQGSNSEREMAHALYLAGFEVRDIHMTDLISGRETLESVQFLGAVGGFSNSDVLGSAKGWAGSFLYNDKAKQALTRFFSREDTLSIGICNGCQLFVALGILYPELTEAQQPAMLHNDSGKFECGFTSVSIPENNAVMLSSLAGSTLGIWVSHGEGKMRLTAPKDAYNIVANYGYQSYPANPNGSDYNAAALASKDGRHLAIMPHLERSMFPWNWAYYPHHLKSSDEVSPWLQAFTNAKDWLLKKCTIS